MSFKSIDAKTAADIQKVGWTMIAVGAGDDTPSFSYSIGLALKGAPEILIYSLPPLAAHGLLQMVYDQIATGRIYQHGDITNRLAQHFPIAFLQVNGRTRRDVMVAATRYHLHNNQSWTALQLMWPDRERRWPWQLGFAGVQPLAGPAPTTLNDRDNA